MIGFEPLYICIIHFQPLYIFMINFGPLYIYILNFVPYMDIVSFREGGGGVRSTPPSPSLITALDWAMDINML